MKVFFIRHGKDDDRYRGGWSDLDLIPEGRQQAKLLADYLKENNRDYRIGKIVSSDLPRAVSTAQFISAELGLPIQKELQLREINNGDLAGMPNDKALERYPGLFFRSLKMNEPYPNGESRTTSLCVSKSGLMGLRNNMKIRMKISLWLRTAV